MSFVWQDTRRGVLCRYFFLFLFCKVFARIFFSWGYVGRGGGRQGLFVLHGTPPLSFFFFFFLRDVSGRRRRLGGNSEGGWSCTIMIWVWCLWRVGVLRLLLFPERRRLGVHIGEFEALTVPFFLFRQFCLGIVLYLLRIHTAVYLDLYLFSRWFFCWPSVATRSMLLVDALKLIAWLIGGGDRSIGLMDLFCFDWVWYNLTAVFFCLYCTVRWHRCTERRR